MINLLAFVILIGLLNQLGTFTIISVILGFASQLYHYLQLTLLVIILGFVGWCFNDN